MACEYRGLWGCRDSGAPEPRGSRTPGSQTSLAHWSGPPDPAESPAPAMNDDHARPIPQRNRPEPTVDDGADGADDVYVVDTRRSARRRDARAAAPVGAA